MVTTFERGREGGREGGRGGEGRGGMLIREREGRIRPLSLPTTTIL